MARTLTLSILLGVLAAPATSMEEPTEKRAGPETSAAGKFVRLRPPLLGFAIERSAAGDRHRLVAAAAEDPAAAPREVILEGTLHECESRLIEEMKRLHGKGLPNVPFATLGGKQFWADVEFLAGWRIQKNVYTSHHRLLDPGDVRHAWGTYEGCRTALEEERVKRRIKPRSDRLVVVLHGLGRSKRSFASMRRALEEEGYEVADVSYPSTRHELREHALQVRGILDRAHGFRTVSFVTHSLGGIVARDLLSIAGEWKRRMEVERVVTIAPPSRGSIIAEVIQDWLPARVILGRVIEDLAPEAMAAVPPPPCEFGIIAGGTGGLKGLNPLLPGDNDGVVTVESTRLAGARDFLLLDASHTFIMAKRECIEATLRFLKTGKLAPPSR